MTTVYFYMKGEPKQFRSFRRYEDAIEYLRTLYADPNCEACGIERRK